MNAMVAFNKTPTVLLQEGKCTDRRQVAFGNVSIRVFEQVLALHPACSSGPSISIGWRYKEKKTVTLEKYELRKQKNPPRRSKAVSQKERKKIAKRFGFSSKEIERNVRNLEKLKRISKPSNAIDDWSKMPTRTNKDISLTIDTAIMQIIRMTIEDEAQRGIGRMLKLEKKIKERKGGGSIISWAT